MHSKYILKSLFNLTFHRYNTQYEHAFIAMKFRADKVVAARVNKTSSFVRISSEKKERIMRKFCSNT